jgi:ATP-dependent helicase HepA
MPENFHPGQRWISESEPELGLGAVVRVTERTVTAIFKASGERREYSRTNAPLKRVRFHPGDRITSNKNMTFTVESVGERESLLFYRCGLLEISEADLSDTITFDKPEARLLAGQVDPLHVFDLRIAALQHQHHQRQSRVRGFVGGRIDLIPHQLHIASEVAGRLAPRVLLADEVGLGKTIEACLILHRLILTGRAQRVLILVPDSLVHQWFVELLRRFNIWFHIFDEERCVSIEALDPEQNPFQDDQLVLCSIRLFMTNEGRLQQAVDAGWDMLVVDEAHHLRWSAEDVSPEYTVVESIARRTPGLLLLTATPEQLGIASHFARLRLLDPDRFYDLDEFIRETAHYRDVARSAEQLQDREKLDALLDRHGPGRVSFRNTRATVTGFPPRRVHMYPLDGHASKLPMVDWLAGLLIPSEPEKFLLICRTQAKVTAIDAALRERVKNLRAAVFHEGLSLVQRDRNAAWFADERGARILICSEIGSEGRNFQFAHHLILFDLPLDPELLEQRIGRLDRIGQKSEIHVHVPFIAGGSHEVLTRWYHEGLNAFEENLHGGGELLERFGARLHEIGHRFNPKRLDRLIEETRIAYQEIRERLHEGRDRLLEMNSFRPEIAAMVVGQIRNEDADESLDAFMVSVFDHYTIPVEELAPRTYRLGSAGVLADSFPGLPSDGFTVTCDRRRALAREDMQFLTWDHPLVTGAMDLLLGSEKGNCAFAQWPDSRSTGLYLEIVFLIEVVAPAALHIDRFLPPTPLRVLIDTAGKSLEITPDLEPGDPHPLLAQPELRELVPRLLERAHHIAGDRMKGIIDAARREMESQLHHEIHRLKELQKVNRSVRNEEIDLLVGQRDALSENLSGARIRVDAIRLIQRGG